MFLLIQYPNANDNFPNRALHNLPHVHKNFPILKHCIRNIDYGLGVYKLINNEGEIVAQCNFQIDSNQLSFTLFEGKLKKELQKMLAFYLTEELAEKAFITNEKANLYYDLDNFYLTEKNGKKYLIGTDYESIISVDIKHIPVEIRHI